VKGVNTTSSSTPTTTPWAASAISAWNTTSASTEFGVADLVSFLQKKGFRTRTAVNPVHADLGFLYAAR
jgi:hypothetical protein